MAKICIAATGDSFITQRLPRESMEIRDLHALFHRFDARFTNLETTIHDFEVPASAVSGGTWAAARPAVLEDLCWLGFNMVAWANNHTLDWTHEGLLQTYGHLDRLGLLHAGVGRNLAEASMPRYLDTAHGRIALIGVNSTLQDWQVAGEQRPDVRGRPGVNPLRFQAIHRLSAADLERLRLIVGQTEINAKRVLSEKEGFSPRSEVDLCVGNLCFEEGLPGTITKMNQEDAQRVGRAIHEARRQADVVLVSHHAHEMKGTDKAQPADFIREFARYCIDAGASAYMGHGPHILRGIEIYQDRPIFYSLGNFIFQNETVERQPAELYRLYGLTPEHSPSDAFDAREQVSQRGLWADPHVFESVIAAMEIEDGMCRSVHLYPVTLGYGLKRSQRGRPRLSVTEDGSRILHRLRLLSQVFGTELQVDSQGIGRIVLG
ncbi:MAG: CapA family protein [Alicyclobacillus sp.]|nr:CapA family protein [Alicyclobacillus sp.]